MRRPSGRHTGLCQPGSAKAKDDIQHTFPEFAPYFGQCRFTGCSHRSETGCAVREAVDSGAISKTRYASYLAMYEEASARKEWEK